MIQEVRITTLEDLMPLLSEQDYRPELKRNRSGSVSSVEQCDVFLDGDGIDVVPEGFAVDLIPAYQVIGVGVVLFCILVLFFRNGEPVLLIPDNLKLSSADGDDHFPGIFNFPDEFSLCHGSSSFLLYLTVQMNHTA